MLNFIGASLVFTGGCVAGYVWSNCLIARQDTLKDFKKSMEFMKTQINWLGSPIILTCREAGERTSGKVGQLFVTFANELDNNINTSTPEVVWETALSQSKLRLHNTDRKILDQIPKCIGAIDKDTQILNLDLVLNELDNLLEEVQSQNLKQVPMAWKLSLIASITMAMCML